MPGTGLKGVKTHTAKHCLICHSSFQPSTNSKRVTHCHECNLHLLLLLLHLTLL
jgi:hypothetical protein